MQRRGQIQVDWVVSLVIFLLYLAFFFIYIRPMLAPPEDLDTLISIAEEGFNKNTTRSIELVPVFISSNITATDEPAIIDLPYNWKQDTFALTTKDYFFFDEDKIFFLANFSPRAIYWLAHNNEENYTLTQPVKDLSATSASASVSTKDFRADFENALLSEVEYKGGYRLSNFNLIVDGKTIGSTDMTNKTTTTTNIIAQYKIMTGAMNHSAYVFAGRSRIYNYVYPYGPTHNLTVSVTIGNYSWYFADETRSGTISSLTCSSFFNNYIDFYDTGSGVTFLTTEKVNMSVCNTNNSAELKLTFPLNNEIAYQIFLHSGDYSTTQQYLNYYSAKWGVVENITGLSDQLINKTNLTSYAALKKQWGYPSTKEFAFYVTNASDVIMYAFEPDIPTTASNVYVKTWQDYLLDKYGGKKLYQMRVKVW